ncbi:MAG TPA: SgcJ/EcaC family oxidoreductase [Coleofasciculaceae cyanobacterium]|jgi:uncharacterized protein (TIGR02246 family)
MHFSLTRRLGFVTVAAFLTIIFVNYPVLSAPSQTQRLTSSEIRTMIQQSRDAWVKGDAAAFAALFTDDGELIVPGQRWQGRRAIETETANFVRQFSVAIEIQKVLVEGNQAAIEWDWQETPKAGGQTRQTQDAILIEFEAGQIRRWREYIDAETSVTQDQT